jgi:dipeptidyl aminopeptidase/acylaminoacyl peptidase
MTPIFADGIDIPIVLGWGLAVLIPLMAFEVFVEAFVLRKLWHLPFGDLCRFTFFANCWSLVGGIPTKILNAFLYGALLLPHDIPGFFARYPFAIAVGSFIYFVITVAIEGAYAFRWRRLNQVTLLTREVWRGVILANVVTYAVLSPLHYYGTRPVSDVKEFTNDARWSSHQSTKIIFTDPLNGYVRAISLDGSNPETIVPAAAKDYLVSADLKTCLFRGANGDLYLYRAGRGESRLIWHTDERYSVDRAAFSPSGRYVAYASEKDNSIAVVDTETGNQVKEGVTVQLTEASVAWSTQELKFFIGDMSANPRLAVTIQQESKLAVEALSDTNMPPLLLCYGRVGGGHWGGGSDWGRFYDRDTCDDLSVWAVPGLGSSLRINHQGRRDDRGLVVAVNPGLLHLSVFQFSDVAFLAGCRECLFQANDYIYLLDTEQKRLGTVARGERFILLTPRYQKQL